MISRKELLDMIATEAIEEFGVGQEVGKGDDCYNSQFQNLSQSPSMQYDLRLVKYDDGRMEWREWFYPLHPLGLNGFNSINFENPAYFLGFFIGFLLNSNPPVILFGTLWLL